MHLLHLEGPSLSCQLLWDRWIISSISEESASAMRNLLLEMSGKDFTLYEGQSVPPDARTSPLKSRLSGGRPTQFDPQCEGALCYDFSRLDDYINQPHVRKELGVGDRKWEACNMDVNFDMQGISHSPSLLSAQPSFLSSCRQIVS